MLKECQMCGAEFEAKRDRARYCRHACMKKAARRANPEKYKQDPVARKSGDAAYREVNRELLAEKQRRYRAADPERTAQQQRDYRNNNRERYNEQCRIRLEKNLNDKIARRLRRRLRACVKQSRSHVKELGCSVDFLREKLEAMWTEGMSWDNYGKWHIDHIRPLSSFDLSDPAQVSEACNYENLQPLWAVDNLRKGATV